MTNKIEQHIREVQNSSRHVRYMRPVVISRIGGVWKINTRNGLLSTDSKAKSFGVSGCLGVAQSAVVSMERGF